MVEGCGLGMRLGESMPEVIAGGKEEEGGLTAAGAGAGTSAGAGALPPRREPKERGAAGGFRSLVAGRLVYHHYEQFEFYESR